MEVTKWLKPSDSVSRIGAPRLPLWVNNGSPAWASECPELGVKRKSISGDWMSACSQEQKFGCPELSKTTSSCRDLAVEANASAVGSKSGQLSVS